MFGDTYRDMCTSTSYAVCTALPSNALYRTVVPLTQFPFSRTINDGFGTVLDLVDGLLLAT